jgi:HEAT repeat protein
MLLYVRDSSRRDVHLKRTALRAIAEIGDADGLAGIIRVLSSDDVYLRDGAIEVLAEAAGTDFGLDPRTPPAAAEAKIRAAQEWWVKKFGKAWTD